MDSTYEEMQERPKETSLWSSESPPGTCQPQMGLENLRELFFSIWTVFMLIITIIWAVLDSHPPSNFKLAVNIILGIMISVTVVLIVIYQCFKRL